MFDEISSNSEQASPSAKKMRSWRSPLIVVGGVLLLVIVVLFFAFGWLKSAYLKFRAPQAVEEVVSVDPVLLGGSLPVEEGGILDPAGNFIEEWQIEYLSFADFYQENKSSLSLSAPPYELPLNIKTQTANYYDLSRRFNLDPVVNDLNNYGVAFLENPWVNEYKDFYGLYAKLIDSSAPLLITSDFLIYHYQNSLKENFQKIEEKVFYDNLWYIAKDLYDSAKKRYEGYLSQADEVNDIVLESARQHTAYLAVMLELLKPTADQLEADKNLLAVDQFASRDIERFNFSLPDYLRDSVEKEAKLIRSAQEKSFKSAVFLYNQDYSIFFVPSQYRNNARLNNLYLALKWLNMTWPLNYQSSDCPDCLLDKDDWRINMIAASLLAKDFYDRPDLKQRWARIYKTIYFFKGLRADFNFVYYRDRLVELFGEDYDPAKLFSPASQEGDDNLEKFRQALLQANFASLVGGQKVSGSDSDIGLKILADYYWPNDYIFSRLNYPETGAYSGRPENNNITACPVAGAYYRCHGFALDAIALVYADLDSPYWRENTAYKNYASNLQKLREELANTDVWHTSNYWSTLYLLKLGFLDGKKYTLPGQADLFEERLLNGAWATWINLQLPPDQLGARAPMLSSLQSANQSLDNIYVETNLSQIEELADQGDMIVKMFEASNLGNDANLVLVELRTLSGQLRNFAEIIKKELNGEALSSDDKLFILEFVQAYQLEEAGSKQLYLSAGRDKKRVREDLSNLKLMFLITVRNGQKIISVGPVFSPAENR